MAVTEALSDALRLSLDPQFYIHAVAMLLVSLGLGIAFIIGIALFGLILLVPAILVYSIAQFSFPALIAYSALILVFLAGLVAGAGLINVVVDGIYLNLAMQFLTAPKRAAKAISSEMIDTVAANITLAWRKTKPRIWDAFRLYLIVVAVMLCIIAAAAALLVLPLLASDVALMGTLTSPASLSALFGALLPFFAFVLLLVAVYFALVPFLAVLFQPVYFEQLSATATIRRAAELGRSNYARNYGFSILATIIALVALAVIFGTAFAQVPFETAMEAATYSGGAGGAATSGFGSAAAGFFMLSLLLGFVLWVVQMLVSLWLNAFSFACLARLYRMDVEGR